MVEETSWTFGTNEDSTPQKLMPQIARVERPLDFTWGQDTASGKLDWEFEPHQVQREELAKQIDWGKLTFWLGYAATIMLAVVWVLI